VCLLPLLLRRPAGTLTVKMRLQRALLVAFLLASCLSLEPARAHRPILQVPDDPAPAVPTDAAPLPEVQDQPTAAVLPAGAPVVETTAAPADADAPLGQPEDSSVLPAAAAVLPLLPTAPGDLFRPDLGNLQRGPSGNIR
jgi:hypothetical protein